MTVPKPVPLLLRPSAARYDAITVGSGLGACVAAALLARHGRRVLVLDKNPAPGGILAAYHRDGFKIDHGSHLISQGARGVLGKVLRTLGAEGPRFLTHPIPVRSRGMFDLAAPPQRRELLGTAVKAAELLGIRGRESARLMRLLFHVFTLTGPELARLDRRTLESFILDHTEHPAAYFFFSFLASIFYVLPPWEVSAGEAIRGLRRVLLAYSLSYVEGGMDSLIHALLGEVVRAGGEVVVSSPVTALGKVEDGIAVVTGDGGEHRARVVVYNGEPGTLLALGRELELPEDYAQRLRGVRGSGNAHQVAIGLPRRLLDEGCMIGGLSVSGRGTEALSLELMRDTVDRISRGELTDPLAVYAPIPTNYDPTLGPPGGQLFRASIYGGTAPGPGADGAERWTAGILTALEQAVPGLVGEARFIEVRMIPEVGAWMGRPSCAAISSGQRPGAVGRARLGVVTPIEGLYLAGDGAGGQGIGTELAASSGMAAARAILRGS